MTDNIEFDNIELDILSIQTRFKFLFAYDDDFIVYYCDFTPSRLRLTANSMFHCPKKDRNILGESCSDLSCVHFKSFIISKSEKKKEKKG